MQKYNPGEIEKKWQQYWQENKTNRTGESSDKKFYILDMFPYPSGEGLHVGHPKGYIATDIYSRLKKMQGYDVLHPMGWDAFGLPAEQFAIKNKVNPNISTAKNVARYKEQLQMIGLNYDWDREINTTDSKFYKWTQWMWKQMYKKGLAYQSYDPINWCPSCKTGLANEDLDGNACERCGTIVEKKPLRQWTIRITDYADRLLEDLDKLDWEPHIKELQRNWIGKSEGSEIDFKVKIQNAISVGIDEYKSEDLGGAFTIFTTRADTLFGCTYTVLAPEHALVRKLLDAGVINNKEEVETYIKDVKDKTDIERGAEGKEKTGVRLDGVVAINPANQKEVPIYIADYVLASYGTGAIMAVPAHDERDYEFAMKYNIEVLGVIAKHFELDGDDKERQDAETIVRIVVDPIVRDSSDNYYLIKEPNGAVHFAGGGVDDGENDIEAMKREIKEELGFIDFEVSKQINPHLSVWGYRHTKNKNQRTVGTTYEVVLNSQERVACEVEEGKHELIVVKKEDVLSTITWTHHKYLFEQYLSNSKVFSEDGKLVNSGDFSGMDSEEARAKITESVGGKVVTRYKLREWVFARQRYWGEPFPIVFATDENGKVVDSMHYAVADTELPIKLPDVENYEPTGTGESPLAAIDEFVNVYGYINSENEFVSTPDVVDALTANSKSQEVGTSVKLFKRETNTMPQWAGSSWYYLRFIDSQNDSTFANGELEKKWIPVDFYVGGAEHATRHLIYARFWHKFLYDIGVVHSEEPFKKLQTVGLIMAEDGRKMSKRWGNVVNPDDVINEFGADTLRIYEMFMGPFDGSVAWSTSSIRGVRRFLDRVWGLQSKIDDEANNDVVINKLIKKVVDEVIAFKFNTAIAAMMTALNDVEGKGISTSDYKKFIIALAPFAPHMCEELWFNYFKESRSISVAVIPQIDESKLVDSVVTLAVQVGGKMRGTLEVAKDADQDTVLVAAMATDWGKKYIVSDIKKIIFVKNKILNIVI